MPYNSTRYSEITEKLFNRITSGCSLKYEHSFNKAYDDYVYYVDEVRVLKRVQPSGTNYYIQDINA